MPTRIMVPAALGCWAIRTSPETSIVILLPNATPPFTSKAMVAEGSCIIGWFEAVVPVTTPVITVPRARVKTAPPGPVPGVNEPPMGASIFITLAENLLPLGMATPLALPPGACGEVDGPPADGFGVPLGVADNASGFINPLALGATWPWGVA